jgi:hypothetical protein
MLMFAGRNAYVLMLIDISLMGGVIPVCEDDDAIILPAESHHNIFNTGKQPLRVQPFPSTAMEPCTGPRPPPILCISTSMPGLSNSPSGQRGRTTQRKPM